MTELTKQALFEFKPGQRVWISKWAVSKGVIKGATFVGKRWSNASFVDLMVDGEKEKALFWPREFHASEAEARAAAKTWRQRRIITLQKQIAKLEQMKF